MAENSQQEENLDRRDVNRSAQQANGALSNRKSWRKPSTLYEEEKGSAPPAEEKNKRGSQGLVLGDTKSIRKRSHTKNRPIIGGLSFTKSVSAKKALTVGVFSKKRRGGVEK